MGLDQQLVILKDTGLTTMDILPVLVRKCNKFIFIVGQIFLLKMLYELLLGLLVGIFTTETENYTGSRLQRVRLQQAPSCNEQRKKFSHNEHPATTNTFLCIKLLVVSGTQYNCFQ